LLRGERIQRLFRVPGNRLEGRDVAPGTDGVLLAAAADVPADALQFAPGLHTLEIEAADVAGHVTTFRAPIRVAPRPQLRLQAVADGARLRWTCDAAVEGRDADSLRVSVESTPDGGRSWTALATGAGGVAGGSGRWQGECDAAAAQALRARVRDRGAVVATATWTPPPARESEAPLAIEIAPRFELRGWLQVDVDSEALLAAPPELVALRRDGTQVALAVEQVDTRRYRATVANAALAPDVAALELRAQAADGRRAVRREACVARIVRRGEPAHIDDLESGVTIDVPAGAALEDVAWRVRAATPPAAAGELAPAGPAWAIEPRGAALDRPVRVAVAGAPTTGAGLFALEPGREPRFVSAERDAEGRLWYESRALATLAVLADATPPAVRGLRVVPRGKRPQRLRFVVRDGGADLGDGGIEVELGGAALIPEWDPETGEVVVEAEHRLPLGTHRLRVVAVDRVGNRTDTTLPFQIR
jgi:hypothetical protein